MGVLAVAPGPAPALAGVVGLPYLLCQYSYPNPTLNVFFSSPRRVLVSYISFASICVSAAVLPPDSFLPLEVIKLA